jgi:hypothetical protein
MKVSFQLLSNSLVSGLEDYEESFRPERLYSSVQSDPLKFKAGGSTDVGAESFRI